MCDEYLDYLKRQHCVVWVNICAGPIDPHHLIARGQRESKRNDFTAVSLCRLHHSEVEQIGLESFEEKYRINLWREAALLQSRFWALEKPFDSFVPIFLGPKKAPREVCWSSG